jgi:hypothetical protein
VISNNTVIDNYVHGASNAHGVGIHCDSPSAVIVNCIVRGNEVEQVGGCDGQVTYSNVEGGYTGTGNIDADPLFVAGPDGCYYLSQTAAGQSTDSPCVDSGSGPAAVVCFTGVGGTVCLDDLTTRIDLVNDSGTVDMGYHHGGGVTVPCPSTVNAEFTCDPSAGGLPFVTTMTVSLDNLYTGFTRRLAGRIDVALAGGGNISNWRSGYANVGPGGSFTASWGQSLPNLDQLAGESLFTLSVEDVTYAPFNQPPYPPAGDTDTEICAILGVVP